MGDSLEYSGENHQVQSLKTAIESWKTTAMPSVLSVF